MLQLAIAHDRIPMMMTLSRVSGDKPQRQQVVRFLIDSDYIASIKP